MFSGQYDHAIDEKGRVSIPARFREILQKEGVDTLIVTNSVSEGQRCLELYPPGEWQRFVNDIKRGKRFNRPRRQAQLFFVALR